MLSITSRMPLPQVNWKRIFYIGSGCTSIAAISAIVIFFGRPWGVIDSTVLGELPGDVDALFFLGHIYKVNIPDLTMSVSWLIGGCGNLRVLTAPPYSYSYCGLANVPINVYVDGVFRYKYDPTIHPVRNYPNPHETLYTQPLNQFQHTHVMDISNYKLNFGGAFHAFEQRYFYPFEEYRLATTFSAFNAVTNASIPIVRLAFSDFVNNFEPQTTEYPTETLVNNTLVPTRTSFVHIQRTSNARTFVMLLFTVNWFLTATVAYITSLALWSNTKLGEGIVILPMTMILTLPALRQLFVDAPSFGVLLDSLGLILQMVIVAICSIILLLGINTKNSPPQEAPNALDDTTDDSETLTNNSKTPTVMGALRSILRTVVTVVRSTLLPLVANRKNSSTQASKLNLKDHDDINDPESLLSNPN